MAMMAAGAVGEHHGCAPSPRVQAAVPEKARSAQMSAMFKWNAGLQVERRCDDATCLARQAGPGPRI